MATGANAIGLWALGVTGNQSGACREWRGGRPDPWQPPEGRSLEGACERPAGALHLLPTSSCHERAWGPRQGSPGGVLSKARGN